MHALLRVEHQRFELADLRWVRVRCHVCPSSRTYDADDDVENQKLCGERWSAKRLRSDCVIDTVCGTSYYGHSVLHIDVELLDWVK